MVKEEKSARNREVDTMTLKDFLSMFVSKDYKENSCSCFITDHRYYDKWSSKSKDNFFIGKICDIPDSLLQRKLDKWDLCGSMIFIVE